MSPAPTTGQRIAAMILLGLILLAVFVPMALAQSQEHIHGHTRYHDHYRFWFRPLNPSVPCCNMKEVSPDGKTSGDCYPTEARVGPSFDPRLAGLLVWWAKRDTGEWIEINDNVVVRYENPDPTGRDAHICEIDGIVFCFRPPVGGT